MKNNTPIERADFLGCDKRENAECGVILWIVAAAAFWTVVFCLIGACL